VAIYLGLLRGINVGGKNRLPMKRLTEIFTDAGGRECKTSIQSGNLLFKAASKKEAASLGLKVSCLLRERERLEIPLIILPANILHKALNDHPFIDEEKDERMVSIGFLSKKPPLDALSRLDPNKSPGDRYQVQGELIFLHTPHGMARSKLTVGYFDRRLGATTTLRNVKTIRALIRLLESYEA